MSTVNVPAYTLTKEEHTQGHSDDQRIHHHLHAGLRDRLAAETEVHDQDGIVVDVTPKADHPRITLYLQRDHDNRYRWYEDDGDRDTEVSASTPIRAWKRAFLVWLSWNPKRLSPTVLENR